jgi:hypothetical protein
MLLNHNKKKHKERRVLIDCWDAFSKIKFGAKLFVTGIFSVTQIFFKYE